MIQVKTLNKQPLSLENFHKRGYEITNGNKTVFLSNCFISYFIAELLESNDQSLIKKGLVKYNESLQYNIGEIKELF